MKGEFIMFEKTKMYVIFSSSGLDHRGAWDASDIEKKVMTNEEMMNELGKQCEGAEFCGEINLIETHDSAIENIRSAREALDGVLIFGPPFDELIETGLPIVSVFPMFGMWMAGFDFKGYKGKKVLTGCLPVVSDASKPAFSARISDLAKKIKLIQSISKMKKLRILSVTDRPVLGSYETGFGNRKEYEKVYLDNLGETFGSEIITTTQEEMFDKIQEVEEEEAEKIAKRWIDGAKEVKDTNEAEIVRSAKLYLVLKEMMGEYDCGAVTTEGYGVFAGYRKGNIPSQGLASSQFCTDGIVATSECLINSLLTQQLVFHITGRLGFNGDYIIDPFNNIAILGHCECPLNPYGDGKSSPYVIRNLPRLKKYEGGACVQVDLPLNETVTVAKISVYDRKISLFTGKTVSGRDFFEDWDDLACRTKLAMETDTRALLDNLDWRTFASHRVAFYGNFTEEIKDLAALIGFEVVEGG
jgi:hypothetical protein